MASACPSCKTPVHFDRRRGVMIDPEETYSVHDCGNPAEYLMECSCGFVVWVQGGGTRLLWPSRQPHRPHAFLKRNAVYLAGQTDRVATWYDFEYERAGLTPPPPVTDPDAPTAPRELAEATEPSEQSEPVRRRTLIPWQPHGGNATMTQVRESDTKNPNSAEWATPLNSSGPPSDTDASSPTSKSPTTRSTPSLRFSPKKPESGDYFTDPD